MLECWRAAVVLAADDPAKPQTGHDRADGAAPRLDPIGRDVRRCERSAPRYLVTSFVIRALPKISAMLPHRTAV